MILGLQAAQGQGASCVNVFGDSELVVNQVLDDWKTRNDRLRQLKDKVLYDMLPRFDSWRIQHVYREDNTEADELANTARERGLCGYEDLWLPSANV